MQSIGSLKRWAMVALAVAVMSGCSAVGRMAVNRVGDSLSAGGSAFASDEDPDLVLEAIPFGLKTYESLLAVSPKHRGLLLSSASGFAAYAFLLRQQAELDPREDYAARRQLEHPSGRLFEHRKLRLRERALHLGEELDAGVELLEELDYLLA